MLTLADKSIADFPRLPGEKNDSLRIQRAIDASPSEVLYFPAGIYEIATPLNMKNLCSLLLHKNAILKAIAAMDFILHVDCDLQHNKKLRTSDMPEDYNLFIRGGQIDGNALASCLALSRYHHFSLADSTFLNGRKFGLFVDENQQYGYELIANNLYFKTVLSGLAGNVAVYACGGDSHYTDIVIVDYTVGFRFVEHGWANRLTRCHVWGGPLPPRREGDLPEMLKDSICFDLKVGGNILRDCYADTGAIGYLIGADTRLLGCSYYSNPIFKLDNIRCIKHNQGILLVADNTFTKTSEHIKIYEGSGKNVIWRDNTTYGFTAEEIPCFSVLQTENTMIKQS